MTGDRADGPTFALEDICFIDFETRSQTDIKAGTYRYACDADAIVLAYAIGDRPVQTIAVQDFKRPLLRSELPREILTFHDRVCRGEAVYAAWNAGFDRAIWNFATLGFPDMAPHHIIDVMAQATASGLPPDLNYASKFSGSTHKVAAGKSLIALFCVPGAEGNPLSHPTEWQEFLRYAAGDIVALRDIFKRTRQLPLAEWKEYWAMEAVNSRGIGIDLKMVQAAAALAEEDRERSRAELAQLTGGAVTSVDQVKRIVEWLLERLPPAGRDILLKREAELDEETGEEKVPAEFNLTRKQVERLIAFNTDPIIDRVLQIRLYGGSKTPAKFKRIADSHVDGVLHGQYVFNGAAQTGRASSKGVQIHNLARDSLPFEHEAIETLLAGTDYDTFAALGDNSPVSRKLSLLIRPAFIPRETNLFVWSDWSQIEARVLPWLCDHMPGAAARLQLFRDVDDDPSVPDLYTRTAAELSRIHYSQVTKEARQRGKVAELALGFGGGKNALQAMAAAYGMHLDDAEAQDIVDRWRAANPWAADFSRELWDAMLRAREMPGDLVPVGRVGFCWLAGYLGGSLLCQLPSGRFLTYRAMRWEMLDKKDDKGVVIGQSRELTYARGHGRAKLWPGIFVENCIAEGTPVLTERGWLPIEQITSERVWDGEAWVEHDGLVEKGVQDTIELDNSWMTPDHKVWTTEGWQDAARSGFNRATVRLPDGYSLPSGRQRPHVADPVRMWQRTKDVGETLQHRRLEILRLSKARTDVEGAQGCTETGSGDAWHVETSGILGVAIDARSVPAADASIVAQLRSARDHGMPGMGSLRNILGRHGYHLSDGIDDRTSQQQPRILKSELCMGDLPRAGFQPSRKPLHRYALGQHDGDGCRTPVGYRSDDTAVPAASRRHRVYDLLNAGRNHCFVIAGLTAPTLVHNCTQAVAADILRGTLVRLEDRASWMPVRLHTHDEVLVETEIGNELDAEQSLRELMQLGFDWSEGLPLMSEETIAPYYSKRA